MENPTITQPEEEFIIAQSRKPTEKEMFYLSWGMELVKNQFNLINELLKQQISISITILGVSLIFEKLFDTEVKYKFVVAFFFFISLLVAFIGLMPFGRTNLWLDCPNEIEGFLSDALSFKKKMYMLSGICIMVGIGIIILKLFFMAFQ